MTKELEQISSDTFVDMINQLANVSPLVGEKTIHQDPGFAVREPNGKTYELPYWDVIRRADETYWSPLDGDRKTIYDVSHFEVQSKKTGDWLPLPKWFAQDGI
ncbi:hypothetical protein H9L19_05545 [Weissella diestrammenae]|uniref:Uncharacterized protein n=1 Tax=Weissella diestrammenae TaxID=1162633 RepID=A0A7G9T438_9LACO|nr:hypothetical protein [Weissella diestrammenae]MCM0583384.1 hypothetical protein [Weissella diestrammenae]QNN74863.1 hypothetical protein H9L19_05545 [Weissella diestrammenae]